MNVGLPVPALRLSLCTSSVIESFHIGANTGQRKFHMKSCAKRSTYTREIILYILHIAKYLMHDFRRHVFG